MAWFLKEAVASDEWLVARKCNGRNSEPRDGRGCANDAGGCNIDMVAEIAAVWVAVTVRAEARLWKDCLWLEK